MIPVPTASAAAIPTVIARRLIETNRIVLPLSVGGGALPVPLALLAGEGARLTCAAYQRVRGGPVRPLTKSACSMPHCEAAHAPRGRVARAARRSTLRARPDGQRIKRVWNWGAGKQRLGPGTTSGMHGRAR